jgi:hypothetical protein
MIDKEKEMNEEEIIHTQKKIKRIKKMVLDSFECSGGHHKQWYLYQIAKEVCTKEELRLIDPGIAP